MHRGGAHVAATDREDSGGHADVRRTVKVAGEPETVEDRLRGLVEPAEVEEGLRDDPAVHDDPIEHPIVQGVANELGARVGRLP